MAQLLPKLSPAALSDATIFVPVPQDPTTVPPLGSVVNGEIPVTVGGWAIGAHPDPVYASMNPIVELYLIVPGGAYVGLWAVVPPVTTRSLDMIRPETSNSAVGEILIVAPIPAWAVQK